MKTPTKTTKQLIPRQKSRTRYTSPQLSMALAGDMISQDEYDQCLIGQMEIQGTHILNLNFNHPTLPTGVRATLYHGRATEMRIDALLGLEPKKS